MFVVFQIVLGRRAECAGKRDSQKKKLGKSTKAKTKGTIKLGELQPEMGAWVRAKLKHINTPAKMTTPTRSNRFHRGAMLSSLTCELEDREHEFGRRTFCVDVSAFRE